LRKKRRTRLTPLVATKPGKTASKNETKITLACRLARNVL
jgi:hypothetical protein